MYAHGERNTIFLLKTVLELKHMGLKCMKRRQVLISLWFGTAHRGPYVTKGKMWIYKD